MGVHKNTELSIKLDANISCRNSRTKCPMIPISNLLSLIANRLKHICRKLGTFTKRDISMLFQGLRLN